MSNLIIVAILLGNYGPIEGEVDSLFTTASLPTTVDEVVVVDEVVYESDYSSHTKNDDEDDAYEGYATDDEDEDEDEYVRFSSDDETCTASSEEDEGDDNLEKRCEEFITKINNEWRAELSKEKLWYK
ncbi:hypothetical protein FRX31_009296 [Thalictrum thalictroides]|uniref:Uncharacterized protein n=1 Tax=Thalictrum thalictroides TaxID=46969 RepID=A0A7J6WX51_THATH|nr:hypothetical protein FRX31_009296 [Thalictrum thalictroides]